MTVVDSMYQNNLLPPQPWEVAGASSVGMTLSMFRFSISFLASVLVGIVFRYVPTPTSEWPGRSPSFNGVSAAALHPAAAEPGRRPSA